MRLLIIEEDAALGRSLQSSLRGEGHQVDLAGSGHEGLARVAQRAYDVILLDLLLRDLHGFDVLTRLRQNGVGTPVLAVGAQSGPAHVVRALDGGADEYVIKPVSVQEISARLRALVRRAMPPLPVLLAFENLALNIVTHQAFVDDRPFRLTPKEFSLLHQFMRRQGETLSRADLLEQVWEMRFDPGSNLVDVHVSRLRSKLQQAGATLLIEAVRGAGFVLSARQEVEPEAGDVVA